MTTMSINPAPFWDRVARKYATKPVPDAAAYATTLERTRQYLGATDRVLEVGAGTSSTAITLAPLVAEYTSSDVSAEMVRIGQEKAEAAGIANLTIRQGMLGDPALGEGPFDAVLAFNLLHLCRDPGAEAAKAHALLKPGGYFISKSGCLGDGKNFLKPVIGIMRAIGRAPYVNFLTREGLTTAIRAAGFEIVETGDFPAKSVSHFVVARRL